MKKKTIIIIIAYSAFLHLALYSNMTAGLSLLDFQKCFAGTEMVERLKSAGITPVNSKIYYDFKTKHKYVENKDDTFSEYSQKGKLLKKIPRNSKVLKDHPYVLPISNDTQLLYTKNNGQGDLNLIVQCADKPHPEGWFLKKALLPIE